MQKRMVLTQQTGKIIKNMERAKELIGKYEKYHPK
jgi:hypothetical protein